MILSTIIIMVIIIIIIIIMIIMVVTCSCVSCLDTEYTVLTGRSVVTLGRRVPPDNMEKFSLFY